LNIQGFQKLKQIFNRLDRRVSSYSFYIFSHLVTPMGGRGLVTSDTLREDEERGVRMRRGERREDEEKQEDEERKGKERRVEKFRRG
jgi:hypothetical protein